MFRDLTLQQFCALDHQRNMVVTAGPGAGKTRILSHRYCFLLLMDERVSVPGILTLTFTEKAAEEMKTRIYSMLSRLDRFMGLNPGLEEGMRKRIHEAREQFFKNNISTVHAFCADLLRDHPVESGLDPSFRIIKGAGRKKLLEEAIEGGIAETWHTRKEDVIQLFRSFGGRGRLARSIEETIEHPLIFDIILKTKETLFSRQEWPEEVFRDYCRYIKEKKLIPYLRGLKTLGNGREKFASLLKTLEEWQTRADQGPVYFGVPRLFETLRAMASERMSGETRLAVRQGLQELSYVDLVQEFYPDVFSSLSPDRIFEKELDLYLGLATVCLERFRTLKKRLNGLDFADLETHCHGLITRLYQSGEEETWRRFQRRFPYVMVDEFQDTNRVQWEIIRLLCSERDHRGESKLQSGKLFVVGDKRQAIYRFRGGDVTVFEAVTREIKLSNHDTAPAMFWADKEIRRRLESISAGDSRYLSSYGDGFDQLSPEIRESILKGDIYLPHNFRTDEVPIRFFNQTFHHIFGNRGAEKLMPYETAPQPIIRPGHNDDLADSQGSVSIYLTGGHSRGNEQAETRAELPAETRAEAGTEAGAEAGTEAGTEAGAEARAEAEASLAVDIIEGIMGRRGAEAEEYKIFGDIREKIRKNETAVGILFFSFNHIKIYEEVLREAGLPFIVHRGKGFFRCQEVMEILQLLNYLTDERQSISLLAALRSPVLGLSDPEIFDLFYERNVDLNFLLSSEKTYIRSLGEQLRAWRTLADRFTPSELIRRIILDRGLTAVLSVHPNGRQRLANIEKLIDLARSFQEDGEGSIRDFAVYCLEMAEEEEEEGEALIITGRGCPIFLMTIHAAKGLEFPLVIIPQLNRRIPSRPGPGRPVRLYDREGDGLIPVWPVEIPGLGFEKRYGPLGYMMMRRNYLEDMAENRRVFYVGCTRAQNHLILMGQVKEKKNNEKEKELNSDDYREKATIMELLDDIYDVHSSWESSEDRILNTGSPRIIRPETHPRYFSGVKYKGLEIDKNLFRDYDKEVKALDLSEPIMSPSYYQLSFKSIRHYRACPLKFYYSVVLGLKAEERSIKDDDNMTYSYPEVAYTPEEDRFYDSRESLIIGGAIHAYLEKHRFGEPLDNDLLMKIWPRYEGKAESDLRLRGVVQRHLKNLVEDKRLVHLLGSGPVYAEIPFLFSVGKGYDFRGFIDRLAKKPGNGGWVILDWKSNDLTGREPGQIAEENDYHLQLACYGWALEKIMGEKAVELYLYFTDRGYLLRSCREGHPGEVINEMIDKIGAYERDGKLAVKEARAGGRPGLSCRFCEYNWMPACIAKPFPAP